MNQVEFDFTEEASSELRRHQAELEAKAREEFSDENLFFAWLAGRNDLASMKEWFFERPRYEQSFLRQCHESCRNSLQRPMPPADVYLACLEDKARFQGELAQGWANEIFRAAVERRPCPIVAAPDYAHVLANAFRIAGVVIVAPPQPAPEEKIPRPRKKS